MSLEGAIQSGPVKEKLRNLRDYLPGQENIVYEFAAGLADRLNRSVVPLGFNMAAELYLYDLQKGVDGFTGKPMEGLTGLPPMIYNLLRTYVPQIAEATCPPEFAARVKQFAEDAEKGRK